VIIQFSATIALPAADGNPQDPAKLFADVLSGRAHVVRWEVCDQSEPPSAKPGLGDMVKSSLAAVGITEERVSKAIGRPCGCRRRAEKLNEIGRAFGIGSG
jgi:hypothetical protein